MKNKNDKRGKSPANFYDRIAEMLGKAAIPQTITVEAEGVSPETFSAAGITKRELYATVAMASLAHAIITTPPVGGGRLRSDSVSYTHLDVYKRQRLRIVYERRQPFQQERQGEIRSPHRFRIHHRN